MESFEAQRSRMVAEQLIPRGITDPSVLEAMASVPREEFVPEMWRGEAYADHPLPIGVGQTISQPYIVALTLEAARIDRTSTLLDIGTGSGYAAVVAARICRSVISIERHARLAEDARSRLARLGVSNVRVVTGDGTSGYPDEAPFDAIVVAAATASVPDAWLEQLSDDGCVVAPVGASGWGQRLLRLRRSTDGEIREENLGGVIFVPLLGGVSEH